MVSVVIVNYNRRDDLREALLSVKKQDCENIEIIVVDNASKDGSRDMLVEEFPEVAVMALQENIGMDGYSVGFRQAKGEFVFQMDNDSLMPDKNVITEVLRRFTEGPDELAVVATRVEEFNHEKDNIEILRLKDNRVGPINTGGFHSGGVGFRRKHLDQVGYYNRDVFLYGSELFLQMKFLAAGYKVFYYPEILVLHKSSTVSRSAQGVYYEVRNRYWFLRCFALPQQQARVLPLMLLRDFFYAAYKRSLIVFVKAVLDGLGRLPDSIRPIHSSYEDFKSKLDEFGAGFSIRALTKRITAAIRERN